MRIPEIERLFEDFYQRILELSPELATRQGERRHDHLLSDPSPAGNARYQGLLREFHSRISVLDPAEAPPALRTSHEVCRRWLEVELEGASFDHHLLQVDPLHGFHILLPNLVASTPFESAEDLRRCLERLGRVAQFVDRVMESTREGLRKEVMQTRAAVEKVIAQMDHQLRLSPAEHPLTQPFRRPPPAVSSGEAHELRSRAERTLAGEVLPAYRRFRDHLAEEYLPRARSEPGIWKLPRGEEAYAWQVRRKTTTSLAPEEVHRLGLEEVERVREEMETVKGSVGFGGSLQEFFAHLRGDPRFYYRTSQELLDGYREIARRADGRLPRFFGKLPRTAYQVAPVPDYAAVGNTTAFYQRPSLDGRRPGTFYANTHDLRSRPRYEMEALTLHEAVPGHHLQIARQMELPDVPRVRSVLTFTSYVEGWGLYAERLGREMGFYTDPHSDFGRLTYEMWRACRLVVDTGLHRLRWSREKAVEHLVRNTPLSRVNIESEVDRYAIWPAQALAYKIGELRILALRRRAERERGAAFDLRAFHDHVLDQGSVPLDILERSVEGWLAGEAIRPAGKSSSPGRGAPPRPPA